MKLKTVFKFSAVALLVWAASFIAVCALGRVAAGLYVAAIEMHRIEMGEYPKQFSDIAPVPLISAEYKWDEQFEMYALTFYIKPSPISYSYSSYTKKWYGGIRAYFENTAAAFLENEFAKAQRKVDSRKALVIAHLTRALGYLSGNWRVMRIADGYQQIGLAYMGMNRPEDVEKNLRKAEELYIKEKDTDMFRFVNLYTNFGAFYYERSRLEDAVKAYSKARNILDTYPEIVYARADESLTGLANSYLGLGETEQARDIYQGILDNKKSAETTRAFALGGLAVIADSENEDEEAERLLEESLKILQKYPDQERNAAQTKMNLSYIYTQLGKDTEAKGLADEAAQSLQKHPDFNAAKLLHAKNIRAVALGNEGKKDEALQMFNELIDDYRKAYGEETPYLTSPYLNIAAFAFNDEEYEKAAENYEKAIYYYSKGSHELETQTLLLSSLAATYEKLNRNSDALKMYEKLLPLVIERDGDEGSEPAKFVRKEIKKLEKKK